MYTEFYGLREKPFALVPDPRYLFLGASHREALAHLLYGIEEGEGFIEVVGQVGTGKTTLCRTLVDRVGPKVDLAYIFNPSFSETELLAAINRDFNVPTAGRSRAELADELNRALLERKAAGRTALLVIDEAQDLEPHVLEQIRLISNLETEREKLIQIVLIGQPELDQLLARPDLRQLRQRITVRWSLEPFRPAETGAYLEHRLRIAGAAGPSLFSPRSVRAIYRASGGVPRVINALADRALLVGYAAGKRRITARDVRRAARELPAAEPPIGLRLRTATALLAAGIAAGLIVAALPAGRDAEPLPPVEAARASAAALEAPPSAPAELPADGLEGSLAALSSAASAASAMDAVLGSWGYPALGLEELDPNDYSSAVRRVSPLRVLAIRAAPEQLVRFDLPSVLELSVGDDLRYAALLALDVDGIAGVETGGRVFELTPAALARLATGRVFLAWTNFESLPAMSAGMSGSAVRWLQARMTDLGYLPPGAASGQFDAPTARAVRAFQSERALQSTGEVGPETLIALYKALRYGAPGLRVQAEGELS